MNTDNDIVARVEAGIHRLQTAITQVQQQSAPALHSTAELALLLEQLREERDATRQEVLRLGEDNDLMGAALRAIARVADRFSAVNDPVVASDGYTYERRDLENYMTECRASHVVARSLLTDEPITDAVVGNHSMKRLLALIREVDPAGVAASCSCVPAVVVDETPSDTGGSGSRTRRPSVGGGSAHSGADGSEAPPQPRAHQVRVVSPTTTTAATTTGAGAASSSSSSSSATAKLAAAAAAAAGRAAGRRLHPCLRVYGRCKFDDECKFAAFPFECCLSFLKGKCKYGDQCQEPHVHFDQQQW